MLFSTWKSYPGRKRGSCSRCSVFTRFVQRGVDVATARLSLSCHMSVKWSSSSRWRSRSGVCAIPHTQRHYSIQKQTCSLKRMEQHRLCCFCWLAKGGKIRARTCTNARCEGQTDHTRHAAPRANVPAVWVQLVRTGTWACAPARSLGGGDKHRKMPWTTRQSFLKQAYFLISAHWQHCLYGYLNLGSQAWICGEITAANVLPDCPFIVKCESLSRIQQILRWFSEMPSSSFRPGAVSPWNLPFQTSPCVSVNAPFPSNLQSPVKVSNSCSFMN